MPDPSETCLMILRKGVEGGGECHVDGWTSQRGRVALAEAESLGLVISFMTLDSQYTAINYRVTDAGRKAVS